MRNIKITNKLDDLYFNVNAVISKKINNSINYKEFNDLFGTINLISRNIRQIVDQIHEK